MGGEIKEGKSEHALWGKVYTNSDRVWLVLSSSICVLYYGIRPHKYVLYNAVSRMWKNSTTLYLVEGWTGGGGGFGGKGTGRRACVLCGKGHLQRQKVCLTVL